MELNTQRLNLGSGLVFNRALSYMTFFPCIAARKVSIWT